MILPIFLLIRKADPMCLAVKVVGDNEDWEVDKTTEYRGTVHFQSARTVRQGQQIALTLLIYFKGAVPENTSALIYLGGGYETYAYQGATSDGWSAAPEMASKMVSMNLFVQIFVGKQIFRLLIPEMRCGINSITSFIKNYGKQHFGRSCQSY